jgi:hypothetical protein
LNAGLCTRKADALPLQPHLQSILFWLFLEIRSQKLFLQLDSNCDPLNFSLPTGILYCAKI